MNRENKIREILSEYSIEDSKITEIIEKINRLENPIDENEIIKFAMLSADIICDDEKNAEWLSQYYDDSWIDAFKVGFIEGYKKKAEE